MNAPILPWWIFIIDMTTKLIAVIIVGLAIQSLCFADSWQELHHQRARAGLPAMQQDRELMRFAQMKAEWQARHHVGLHSGGNGHEGPNTPPGCREGTGCLPPNSGWATCLMWLNGSHPAGTGLAIGSDGRRYMCFIIRCSQGVSESRGIILCRTAHLSPNASRVDYDGPYNRQPSYKWFTPSNIAPTWNKTMGLRR